MLQNLNNHYAGTIASVVQRQIILEEKEQMTEAEVKRQIEQGLIASEEGHKEEIAILKESIKFNERKLTIIEKMKTNTVKYIKEEEQKIIEQNDDGLDVIANQEYSHKPNEMD